ncbi:short-chain dehydrogenase [Amylibacter marinus]|uniref:Short-chain dehydrogenase n=1 Tax=Amylibacter marinus TaxID=1475483 RepID=A0ABQ5VWQ9_9RHOB|nr:SDR family oxidoreductase [Amylibacter marinus]GLQ35639.1 short-chain dehydrogenase [Amylibacter marinus]
MTDFTGKTVVITGASRGIGEATAREFYSLGANVVVSARSTKPVQKLAASLGARALSVPCDVANSDAVQNLMQTARDHFGSLDIVINNAGIIDPVERLEEADPEAWAMVLDINTKGAFHGIRHALPLMKAQGGGTIITIGSGAATSALEGWSHYCASKAAVHHLNACLHKEEAANGIRALVLSPGTVATDMQHVIADSGVNPVSQIPWDEHIPVSWPAKALAWMADNDSDEWLGQVVSLREHGIRARVGLI